MRVSTTTNTTTSTTQSATQPPLIAHIIHRLDVGGLENGLVNLINHMPVQHYRHVIICMTDYSNEFRQRIMREDVDVYALHKNPGQDFPLYFRLWKLLRKLKPAIVHTRNIGTLECVVAARLAGVGRTVHGEHGRDMVDLYGDNKTYKRMRRILQPMVSRFIALSKDLNKWLISDVRIPEKKVVQIYNGVDVDKFSVKPEVDTDKLMLRICTVGRLSAEKNQTVLVDTMKQLFLMAPSLKNRVQLSIIGNGPLKAELQTQIEREHLHDAIELLGARDDVAEILRTFDLFVLPSLGEGISNTILEAMASGLPVIATEVGGNPELVVDEQTGFLVKPGDAHAMAAEIKRYAEERQLLHIHSKQARKRVLECFSMSAMVRHYQQVYDELLAA